mgnify:CR=1 FL=1
MGSKVCAIIGMGTGVGAAVARRFGAEGYCVAMISRNAGKLERYEHELAARGVTAQGFVADAGSDESIVSAIEVMRQAMPPPEVLVFNASVPREGAPSVLDPEALAADLRADRAARAVNSTRAAPIRTPPSPDGWSGPRSPLRRTDRSPVSPAPPSGTPRRTRRGCDPRPAASLHES